MMAVINGLATVLAMTTFLGIVWWAFSAGRADANREASLLPFALPDEPSARQQEGVGHE